MTAIDTPDSAAPSSARFKSRPARFGITVLIGLGVIAAIAFGAHWLMVGRFLESTNDAYLKADPMVVAPRISGYVSEVAVVSNQDVEAGQVLVRIEDGPYKAELAKAKAQVDSAAADVKQLQAQIARQKAILDQANSAAAVAAAQEAYAGREADRFGQLSESGAVSRQQVDQAHTLLTQRQADLANARAAVISAQRQIDVLDAQVGQAESAREAAEATAQAAQIDYDATVLKSRIKGRVGDKTVSIGQYVQAGTRLMSVMPLQDIYLEANYKETQIGRMRIGQPVEIRVDALPDLQIGGHVESLSPGTGAEFALLPPENATGNFTKIVQRVPVRIRVDADAAQRALLLPGLSVTATVDTRSADH
ncbi:MAG TPA: HlyD family secretion protein [Alphaproteobacteria bacterium]|nr:HlyD family secretion protein [Alphaproteobacteria bacterium]